MVPYDLSEVKKSIFQLWSGIVLGWSGMVRMAPKVPKKYFFRFYDARRGYPGLPPGYPAEHRNRNLALTPSFMDPVRARKGAVGLARILHNL